VQGTPRHETPHPDQYSVKCAQNAPKIDMLYVWYGPQCTDLVPVARKKAHSLEADEFSDLPVSEYVSLGLSEEPFCGVEHAWKPQASMREMHL